jgi:phospholipid/cholesterol/gamma-HCH transport system substrate-binding protein
MDERVMQFRVGVMFLATLIITGILLVLFGKLPDYTGNKYAIRIRFADAGGVAKDTPVRKSGILIGRVSDVQLIDKDSGVLVTAKIQADKAIYENEVCSISRNLLSGDTALIFTPNPNKRGLGQPIVPDAELPGFSFGDPDDPTGLKRELRKPIDTVQNTGVALTEASKKLGEAADRVEEILDPEAQKNVQSILRDSAAALKTIQSVLGDDESRQKLTEAMKKLPETIDNMNNTFKATDETLRKFAQRTDGKTPVERMVSTIEMTERTLRKFSEPRENGEPAPADQIATAVENLSEITTLMRSIMTRIDDGEGSLGALMKDRQLYDRLNHTAKNLEDVSQQLKPIVADARVFSDKIARHPGVIVRDAVKPQVGIK